MDDFYLDDDYVNVNYDNDYMNINHSAYDIQYDVQYDDNSLIDNIRSILNNNNDNSNNDNLKKYKIPICKIEIIHNFDTSLSIFCNSIHNFAKLKTWLYTNQKKQNKLIQIINKWPGQENKSINSAQITSLTIYSLRPDIYQTKLPEIIPMGNFSMFFPRQNNNVQSHTFHYAILLHKVSEKIAYYPYPEIWRIIFLNLAPIELITVICRVNKLFNSIVKHIIKEYNEKQKSLPPAPKILTELDIDIIEGDVYRNFYLISKNDFAGLIDPISRADATAHWSQSAYFMFNGLRWHDIIIVNISMIIQNRVFTKNIILMTNLPIEQLYGLAKLIDTGTFVITGVIKLYEIIKLDLQVINSGKFKLNRILIIKFGPLGCKCIIEIETEKVWKELVLVERAIGMFGSAELPILHGQLYKINMADFHFKLDYIIINNQMVIYNS